jgi:hypothetical protein
MNDEELCIRAIIHGRRAAFATAAAKGRQAHTFNVYVANLANQMYCYFQDSSGEVHIIVPGGVHAHACMEGSFELRKP